MRSMLVVLRLDDVGDELWEYVSLEDETAWMVKGSLVVWKRQPINIHVRINTAVNFPVSMSEDLMARFLSNLNVDMRIEFTDDEFPVYITSDDVIEPLNHLPDLVVKLGDTFEYTIGPLEYYDVATRQFLIPSTKVDGLVIDLGPNVLGTILFDKTSHQSRIGIRKRD